MKLLFSILLSFSVFFSNESSASIHLFKHGLKRHSPNVLHYKLKRQVDKNKKLTAAVLAFPLPFGFFGAHRIYMGTKPNVPVTYIATLGGCLGILPLIDFIVILCNKDLKKFEKNEKVFMWND